MSETQIPFLEQLGTELRRAADAHAGGPSRSYVSRRPRLWAAIGASGAAVTAAIVAAVLLLSAGAPAAFAGWSRIPTTPTPSALESAVHRCYKVGSGNPKLALPAPGGTMRPVLAEARGASAAAIYVVDDQAYMCLTINEPTFRAVNSYVMGPAVGMPPALGKLSVPYGISGGSGSSRPTHPHRLTHAQMLKQARERIASRRAGGSLFFGGGNFALGQAGSGVSSITFAFANGRTVVASIQHGWYFAWWPWSTEPTSATITTSNSAKTSAMRKAPHDGFGQRPYPACRPGSTGCAFAIRRPVHRRTTAPAIAISGIAEATQECDSFTLSSAVMSADAFVRTPVLTVTHGSFHALLNVTDGKVDLCLIGGDQKNLNAFFAYHLENLGPAQAAPAADLISVPYQGDNGVGGGRMAPSLKGEPPALRHIGRGRDMVTFDEYIGGAGYGPFVLGRTGSDVTAVSFTFANGQTTHATVANGWYFAWWPWLSNPKSVTVRTASGSTTSPVTGSQNARRDPIAPGCKPGSPGCVFGGGCPDRRGSSVTISPVDCHTVTR